jgi:hypothetical protein
MEDFQAATFTYNFKTSPGWLRWLMEPIAGFW